MLYLLPLQPNQTKPHPQGAKTIIVFFASFPQLRKSQVAAARLLTSSQCNRTQKKERTRLFLFAYDDACVRACAIDHSNRKPSLDFHWCFRFTNNCCSCYNLRHDFWPRYFLSWRKIRNRVPEIENFLLGLQRISISFSFSDAAYFDDSRFLTLFGR